jgi:hypothetical protein
MLCIFKIFWEKCKITTQREQEYFRQIDSRLDNQEIEYQFLAVQEFPLLEIMQTASKSRPSW